MFKKIFTLLLITSFCYAGEPIKQVVDGKEYACFEPKDAQRLLQIYIDFPKLELKIKALEDLDLNLTSQTKKTDELQINLGKQVDILQKVNVELQEKITDMNSWWRSPWLWFAVGVVISTGTCLGIFWAVK